MDTADEPRFVLLDIGRSDIIVASGLAYAEGEPSNEEKSIAAAIEVLTDEDIKWIADHVEEHGGAGIVFEYISDMMPEPDEELRQFCHDFQALGQNISAKDADSLIAHLGLTGDDAQLTDTQLGEIVSRAAGPTPTEFRSPVYKLTRTALLELFDGFGYGDELWQNASDEELHRACAIANAGIRGCDDAGEDIFAAFSVRANLPSPNDYGIDYDD